MVVVVDDGGRGDGVFVDFGTVLDALFDDVACAGAGGDDFEFAWVHLVCSCVI